MIGPNVGGIAVVDVYIAKGFEGVGAAVQYTTIAIKQRIALPEFYIARQDLKIAFRFQVQQIGADDIYFGSVAGIGGRLCVNSNGKKENQKNDKLSFHLIVLPVPCPLPLAKLTAHPCFCRQTQKY